MTANARSLHHAVSGYRCTPGTCTRCDTLRRVTIRLTPPSPAQVTPGLSVIGSYLLGVLCFIAGAVTTAVFR